MYVTALRRARALRRGGTRRGGWAAARAAAATRSCSARRRTGSADESSSPLADWPDRPPRHAARYAATRRSVAGADADWTWAPLIAALPGTGEAAAGTAPQYLQL